MSTRDLRTTAFASREELADALQSLFVAELLLPSKPLWIVTPWVSDVPIIDNRAGRFRGLIPGLAHRWIRLGELLEHQIERGGSIVLACRPNDHNETFTGLVSARLRSLGLDPRFLVCNSLELHEKGILAGGILLSGSMNLTYNGIRRLEESIHLTDDTNRVARARVAYKERWGAP